MQTNTESVYFKLPRSLKFELDAMCKANGYTKTMFLTNYICDQVKETKKVNPDAFKDVDYRNGPVRTKWMVELLGLR